MNRETPVVLRTPDGLNLAADLGIPDTRASRVVIMCHGISSHRAEYLDMFPVLVEKLLDRSVATLRFDFRAHGESEGDQRDFTVSGQLVDLRTALRYCAQNFPDVPVSFIGVSFGAAPGVIVEATRGAFASLALFAPVLSYVDTFLNPSTEWGKKNFSSNSLHAVDQKGYLLLDGEFEIGPRLIEEFHAVSPERFIPRVAHKTLLIHGTSDSLVPVHTTQRLADDISELTVEIVPRMDHGLYVAGDPEGESTESKQLQEGIYGQIVEHVCS